MGGEIVPCHDGGPEKAALLSGNAGSQNGSSLAVYYAHFRDAAYRLRWTGSPTDRPACCSAAARVCLRCRNDSEYHQARQDGRLRAGCRARQSGAGSEQRRHAEAAIGRVAGSKLWNPATIRPGNQNSSQVQGPGRRRVDLTIAKSFDLRHAQLQVRFESFNVFNWRQYNNPVTNVRSPTFGRIQSVQSTRTGQVGLRLTF